MKQALAGQEIINETFIIKSTLEESYSNCLDWLFSINATIAKIEKPNRIIASHKGVISSESTYLDWPKLIEVNLESQESFSKINIVMREPEENDYIQGIENRKVYWMTLLNGLQESLGIPVIIEDKKKTFPVEYFEKESWNNVKNIGAIALFLVPICLYLLFYPLNDEMFGGAIIGLLVIIIFSLRGLYKQYKINHNFSQIHYPNVFSKGRYSMIMLLLILISGPVMIITLSHLNIGISHYDEYEEYNNYGFTFEHPIGIEFEETSIEGIGAPSNFKGMISGDVMRGWGQSEGILLYWESVYLSEEDRIQSFLNMSDVIYLTPIQELSYKNYTIYYRNAFLNENSTEVYSNIGLWSVKNQNRLYVLMYLNTKNIADNVFEYIVTSFNYNFEQRG